MDKLLFGLSVTAIGILIVFFGLILLIGLIKLVSIVTSESPKPKKEKKVEAAPVAAPVAVAAPVPAAPAQDDALIAVITAAIAAAMENGAAFTVRRVRRISNSPAWQKAGREEQTYSRF